MEDIIRVQRATKDEHIREENAHNWPGVYGTFVQDEHSAFYDVVPLHTHFAGLSGVKDFYKAARDCIPGFQNRRLGRIRYAGMFHTRGDYLRNSQR